VPLRISLVIGVFMFILSSLGIIYGLIRRVFFDDWVSGWSITFVSMMLISALQFIMIGILSEYISRIYTEALNRPLYVVSYINGKVKKNAPK
jgi:polyisoprenyl-phosphate glycosyltransferase